MNWFRHYSGSAFHPKWRTVARRTGATIERVNFVWESLLEHASAQDDDERGSVAGWDPEVVADHLMCDAEQIRAIRRELETVGSLAGDRVEGWERRQFVSDSSAERVRRHRERKRGAQRYINGGETPPSVTNDECNVTSELGNAPEQSRTEQSQKQTHAAAESLPRAPAREEAAAADPAPPVIGLPTALLEEATRRTGVPDDTARALFDGLVEMAGTVPLARAALRKGLDCGTKPWSYAAGAARGFRADAQRDQPSAGVTLADTMALMAKYQQMEQTDGDQPTANPALLN